MPRGRPEFKFAARAETFRVAPSHDIGKTDAGGGWLRVQFEQPGVLLLRCLGPGRPRAMFGHTGLRMLICRCECAHRGVYSYLTMGVGPEAAELNES